MPAIEDLEREIAEKYQELARLRQMADPEPVPDYTFETLTGPVSLSALFAGRDQLLVIHNMGQACRYCTLWADGINGILAHLEDAMAVVLVSKDAPDVQARMARDRGWGMRLASHGGGAYMAEQVNAHGMENFPGAALYERRGDAVLRRARTFFGPGDPYSPLWHFLALTGRDHTDWTPQFTYWSRPEALEDGGENVRD